MRPQLRKAGSARWADDSEWNHSRDLTSQSEGREATPSGTMTAVAEAATAASLCGCVGVVLPKLAVVPIPWLHPLSPRRRIGLPLRHTMAVTL